MSQYLDTACELAAAAGQTMLEHFDIGVAAEWKQDNTPVTAADDAINRMVVDRIAAQYPDHGVVGEEASLPRPDAAMQWVCDPIDGTVPFMLGIPTNVFALALCENGRPIVAVVNDPFMRRLYTATAGEGTFVNDRQLHVSGVDELRGSFMNVSGRSSGDAARGTGIYRDLEDAGVQQLHHNSMVYEAVLVASGMFAAAIFAKKTQWDAAAAVLLVEEAGGNATDLVGNDQRYDRPINGTIFSNGHVHQELVDLVRPHLLGA